MLLVEPQQNWQLQVLLVFVVLPLQQPNNWLRQVKVRKHWRVKRVRVHKPLLMRLGRKQQAVNRR